VILDSAVFASESYLTKEKYRVYESHLGRETDFDSHLYYMDTISNMIITIKNGAAVKKAVVTIPYSKFKVAIAKSLLDAGYISGYEKKDRKKGGSLLDITLAYKDSGKSAVTDVERLSKLSRRLYVGVKEIPTVRQGYGHVFISTPKGVLTGSKAKEEMVGGELLFKIW
jgi:small subunit ribosomal protein S8